MMTSECWHESANVPVEHAHYGWSDIKISTWYSSMRIKMKRRIALSSIEASNIPELSKMWKIELAGLTRQRAHVMTQNESDRISLAFWKYGRYRASRNFDIEWWASRMTLYFMKFSVNTLSVAFLYLLLTLMFVWPIPATMTLLVA